MTASVERADPRAWLAVVGAIFGTFMALLDISVTNASLPQIQGEIGATGTEGTWIGTGYLAAEIVMIPLTAWLSRLLGMRALLMMSSLLFTAFSVECGLSTNLSMMIVGRVGQGFFGGALVPASLTIIATRLPARQRPLGLAIYASAALLAPLFGPLVGGWLTETFGWPAIFYTNLPVEAVLIVFLFLGFEAARPNWRELARADWFGILGLAMGMGGLTIILEEGQREDWFASPLISRLTVVTVIGFVLMAIAQFTNPHPVMRLRLLRDSGYRAVILTMMVVGGCSYVVLYLGPIFLGTVVGYNAQQTGAVTLYLGAGTFLIMPFLSVILHKVDIRILIAVGSIGFAVGALMNLSLTPESAGTDFIWPLFINGLGQPAAGFPLSQAATTGLPEDDIPYGTAIFSMSRNLGGSIGLALVGILIDRRLAFHTAQLGQAVTANSIVGQERIGALAARLMHEGADPAFATLQAMRLIGAEMQRQALVLTYIDGFWAVGIASLLAIPIVLLIKKPRLGATTAAH